MPSIRDLFVTIGINADTKEIEKLNTQLKQVGTVAKWAGVAIAGAVTGASVWAVKLAADFEQTEIAFETMLGSGEKAKALIQDLRRLAATSPFTFLETTKHAKKLLAYGIEGNKVVETMKMLGDIASGVGKDRLPFLTLALGQIRAKGVLAGQELRQLTETGVPIIDELAKVTGKSRKDITDRTKDLGITFAQVEQALKNMTTEGGKFYNLMAKQNKTTLGQLSNIQDVLEEMATAFGKDLLQSLKPIVVAFREWLEVNQKLIQLRLKGWAESLGTAITWVKNNAETLIMVLQLVGFYLAGLATGKAAYAVLKMFQSLTKAMLLNAAAGAINMAFWIAIGVLFGALYLIIKDVYGYFQGKDSLFGRMIEHNDSLKTLAEFLEGVRDALAGIAEYADTGDFGLIAQGFEKMGLALEKVDWYVQRIQPFLKMLSGLANFDMDKFGEGYVKSAIVKMVDLRMKGQNLAKFLPGGGNASNQPNITINVDGKGFDEEKLATFIVEKSNEQYATAAEGF